MKTYVAPEGIKLSSALQVPLIDFEAGFLNVFLFHVRA